MSLTQTLIEPSDLIAWAGSIDTDRKNSVAIFLDSLRPVLYHSIRSLELFPELRSLPESFDDFFNACFASLKNAGDISCADKSALHACLILSEASILEDSIESSDANQSAAQALKLISLLLSNKAERPTTDKGPHSANLLKANYPKVSNMLPSSLGGQLEDIILRGRELWKEHNATPEWKNSQAVGLFSMYMGVIQNSMRYENELIDPELQTFGNEMERLEGQMSPELLLHFARRYKFDSGSLNPAIKDSEIFSLFAMINAFDGLEALENADLRFPAEDLSEVYNYLSEANAFIRLALECKALETGQVSFKEGIEEGETKGVSKQNKSNREGETRAKQMALLGLMEICKEVGNAPSAGKLQKWLSGLPDSQFDTNIFECTSVYLKTIEGKGQMLSFDYRNAKGNLETKMIEFSTYGRQYLPRLKEKLGRSP